MGSHWPWWTDFPASKLSPISSSRRITLRATPEGDLCSSSHVILITAITHESLEYCASAQEICQFWVNFEVTASIFEEILIITGIEKLTNVSDSGLMSPMRLILCDKIIESSARCPIRWPQIETGQIFSEPSQIVDCLLYTSPSPRD